MRACQERWCGKLLLSLPESILSPAMSKMATNDPSAILDLPMDKRLFVPVKRLTDQGTIDAALAALIWIASHRPPAIRAIESSGLDELRPLCHQILAEFKSHSSSPTLRDAWHCLQLFIERRPVEIEALAEASNSKPIKTIAEALVKRLKAIEEQTNS